MPSILAISASPSRYSKTAALADFVLDALVNGPDAQPETKGEHLRLRDLPAEALLSANTADPEFAAAIAKLEAADAVIIATPIYKASFSGLFKAFVDPLSQFALDGKVILPLATGGSIAHVLALDYGLRPVLQSLGARHVVQSFFLLDKNITKTDTEPVEFVIDDASQANIRGIVADFRHAIAAPARKTTIARSA
jgi:FMN reductase